MCGSLRRECLEQQAGHNPVSSSLQAGWGGLGDRFLIRDSSNCVFEAIFDGHARFETLDKWTIHGWQEGKLIVGAYTEGYGAAKKEFSVPAGKNVKCIFLNTGKQKVFKVITRDATPAEKQTHPRFPITE